MSQLQKMIDAGPALKALLNLNGPCALAVSDHERFVYAEDNMGMNVVPGDQVKPGSATETAMREGTPVVRTFDEANSAYGVAYTSMSSPIFDENGQVVGCLSWTIPTNRFQLTRMSQELSSHSQELAAGAEQFASNSEHLVEANHDMLQLVERLNQQMENIGQINGLISELASQSQLLGLNAAIEAAHAGEQGRGFAIVASEIRKLAVASHESAKDISSSLEETVQQVKEVLSTSQNVSRIGEQQAQSAEQFAAAIGEVSRLADSLYDLSNEKE